jgi:serine/threonine-protein kinase
VWLQIAVLWTVFLGAAWLGIRNFRSGRGDRSGALRLAVFMFIGLFVDVLLIAHHTPDSGEVGLLLDGISRSLLLSMTAWAAYMTLEPYVRRHWPHALVSWTRILAGNLRDPVVAGHILLGMGAGFVLSTMGGATRAISGSVFVPNPAVLEPVRFVGDAWFGQAARVTSIGLAVFFTIFLARVVLRRTWLAFLATLSLGFLVNFSPGQAASVYAVAIVTTAIFMGLALRFGLVPPTAAALFSQIAALASPANFGEWYGTAGWMHMALVLAVAIWAFRNALGGRKVWEAELLE